MNRENVSGASGLFFACVSSCLVLVAVLVCADIFFIRRAKMLDALVSENWPALSSFFESEMLEKGRFSRRDTELFINVLVLLSDYETLRALFSKLKGERLDLYRLFVPDFIAASIVFDNTSEAEACISSLLMEEDSLKAEAREWVEFYSAFLNFRNGKYRPSSEGFAALASSATAPVVCAVSGYFCGKLIPAKTFGIGVSEKTLSAASDAAREKILSSFSDKRWQELCAKARKSVRAAVIGKTINSATEWIFSEQNQAEG